MKSVNPYLNFPGNTLEAFEHYRSIFGGEFMQVVRFRDMPNTMGIPEEGLDAIAHIALPLGADHLLMGTDVIGPWAEGFTVGSNTYIALETDTVEDAERLFEGLSAGGAVEMPLEKVEWAEKYGSCKDRFGVQWMVMYTGEARWDVGMAG